MVYHYSLRSCSSTLTLPGMVMVEEAQEDRFLYKQLTYDDSPDTWPVDYYTCALSGDL